MAASSGLPGRGARQCGHRVISLYWCRSCGRGRNFGDQLGPRLLAHYGYRFRYGAPRAANLVSVGSVLSRFSALYQGTILGTGYISPTMRGRFPLARVLAVRGRLTRTAARLPAGTLLGDPGILVVDLVPGLRLTAAHEAIVPHYVDDAMARRHPDTQRISIRGEPVPFLTALAAASVVYTSSLHALIAADALGVPQVLEMHPRVVGGLHKFQDYASAFGDTIEPGVPHLTDRGAMAERQAKLREAYRSLT